MKCQLRCKSVEKICFRFQGANLVLVTQCWFSPQWTHFGHNLVQNGPIKNRYSPPSGLILSHEYISALILIVGTILALNYRNPKWYGILPNETAPLNLVVKSDLLNLRCMIDYLIVRSDLKLLCLHASDATQFSITFTFTCFQCHQGYHEE